ncbi:MAG: hypothetical protein ACM3ZA_00730 [Bacillota bacterium]
MEAIHLLHGLWRWAVLAAAVLSLVGAFLGTRDSAGAFRAQRFGLWYAAALDLQVTLGLIMWVGEAAWRSEPFVAFIHPVAMLIGSALAHIGRGRQKRLAAGGRSSIAPLALYIGSLAVLLLAMPRW